MADEKTKTIREIYDQNKIVYNNEEEFVKIVNKNVQNYLKAKFSDWISENNVIDNLIQKWQTETLIPKRIVEWIPYNNLQNIKYLTKVDALKFILHIGLMDVIVNGILKKTIKKSRPLNVILKKLKNVENADQSWFEKAKSHLAINGHLYFDVMNQLIWKGRILIMCYIIDAIDRIHFEKAIIIPCNKYHLWTGPIGPSVL
ncbi:hypothetical protein C1645_838924 [Glomus cerebriforme]|uniref:Uncharacterized protein n=1 Tax=Glomus cerebriforme TaxID=658196 RepID=A0A397S7M2_9GLOM|nr:hypothetical protein C1645_838924 [Glomus cerebriforme]